MNDRWEKLGQPDIKIVGLQLWIHGRQFPDSNDYWDGDWLNITAYCGDAGASVFTSCPILRLSELTAWHTALEKMRSTLSGEAKLECIERELSVVMKAGSLGHIKMEVNITPDNLSQEHRFVLSVDQSYLPELISQCETVLNAYSIKYARQQAPKQCQTVHGKKLNIWWKLAIVSLVINIISIPFWIFLYFSTIALRPIIPPHLTWLLFAFFALSSGYFSVFVIWHWRTRYAGSNHLIWPILAVILLWPNFVLLMSGTIFISLAYFFMHVFPDIRKKGAYAISPVIEVKPPASPIPPKYQLARSACFTLGWALLILGIASALLSCWSHFVCWNALEQALPGLVGKPFTKDKSDALILASYVGKTAVLTNVVCSLGIALGGILLYISQRMRWRLLDDHEKEKLAE